jgi:hypothetical protein
MSENSNKLGDSQGRLDEDPGASIADDTASELEVALLLEHIHMQGGCTPKCDRRVYGGEALSKEIAEVRKRVLGKDGRE